MNVQINLFDLGIIIIGTLIIITLAYLIIILRNFSKTMKVVKNLIENNEKSIEKVIEKAPSITSNIEDLSSDISSNVRAAQGTITNILGTGEVAASNLAEHSGIISQALGVVHILYKIKDIFSMATKRR